MLGEMGCPGLEKDVSIDATRDIDVSLSSSSLGNGLPRAQMEEDDEMDCPGLKEALDMASMRERLMELEGKEPVWNQTMEHVLNTMFATNTELEELQTSHTKMMQKHEMEIHEHETELAKIKGQLKERTKAAKNAQKACPLMLARIASLRDENQMQASQIAELASEIAELRNENERLSTLLDACQGLEV